MASCRTRLLSTSIRKGIVVITLMDRSSVLCHILPSVRIFCVSFVRVVKGWQPILVSFRWLVISVSVCHSVTI